MKIRWLIGGVVLAMAFALPAQAQFFADNFDSYAAGSGIIGQGGWDGWDGSPAADAMVTTAQAFSAPNSLAVSGAADVVQQFVGASGGVWYAKVQTYVPSSQTGELFFIILDQYAPSGTQHWAVQVAMCQSGCVTAGVNPGSVSNLGGSDVPGTGVVPLLTDQWVEVIVEIDFGSNLYTVTYGGAFLDIQQWTTTGSMEVSAFDLFSSASSESYMDNVWLDTSIPVELMNFDVE